MTPGHINKKDKEPIKRVVGTGMVVTRMLSSKVSTYIPIHSRSILIGAHGRNASLIGKYAHAFVQCSDEGEVTLVPRAKESDLELGKRMVQAIVAGSILRWFMHPGATQKFYHASIRPQLQELAATLTQCTCGLQLLRAHKGHMCLFLMPLTGDHGNEYELIRAARPALLAKIKDLASSCDPDEEDAQPKEEEEDPLKSEHAEAPAPPDAAPTPTPE
jgi:hypothetical protein